MSAALDLHRLASHASAGSRFSGVHWRPVRGFGTRRAPYVCQKLHLLSRVDLSLGWSRSAKPTVCRVLEEVDYVELYQERCPTDINLQYLWDRLEPLLYYLPDRLQVQTVKDALEVAYNAHRTQFRKSGEPFITHPVEVARILAEMKTDCKCLVAGLLHDTVEDTDSVSFDDIEAMFGRDVRRIVEGETKLSKITKVSPDADQKARDLQQLFIAMTEDVRIILVKLADRLHNMRTLYGMSKAKQLKISNETLQVFAPLAKLLGIYCIKEELEDLSLKYLDAEAHAHIKRWQDRLAKQHEPAFLNAQRDLDSLLASDSYLQTHAQGCTVRVRQKSAYSIYKRLLQGDCESGADSPAAGTTDRRRMLKSLLYQMKEAHKNFYLQVAVQEPGAQSGTAHSPLQSQQLCYHVLGLVHSIWSPIPGALKDFIGSPKTNGYQSLHTTVVPLTILAKNCSLIPVEVQIRTLNMDVLAEFGVAASNWLPQPVKLNGIKVCSPSSCPGADFSCNGHAPISVPSHSTTFDPSSHTTFTNGNGSRHNGLHGVYSISLPTSFANGNGSGAAHNGQAYMLPAHELPAEQLDSSCSDPSWLAEMRKWQEEMGSLPAREFVDGLTAEVLGQSVFVYTHTGDLRRLPKGSTVVDFAYSIHSELGQEMIGARVNGRYVRASHVLSNGEVVEIKRDRKPPTPAAVKRQQQWLGVVRTRNAKLKIKQFLREAATQLREQECEVPESLAREGTKADDHSVKVLTVLCQDKLGLLAKVSGIISACSHNIVAYSGRPGEGVDFEMSFTINGPNSQQTNMVKLLSDTPGVESTDCSPEC